ncbi:MAG: PhzF family phenazine biosynthesis protein [Symbiobacteriaceae bacterium]|jgi:PhzF family phenazine biosynthesis protein|nr:PhzF family phenazine biosynthesis protein [Symbiobacteriaceae bacterium]
MQAQLVDVFTLTPGEGNPGAVVTDAGDLTHADMAGIAARLGVETTFVDGTTLRYYQPSGAAMTLCGHGTLAALAVMGRQGEFRVSTPAGDLPVLVEPRLFGMQMPPVTLGEPLPPAVAARGLGIDLNDIDGPVQVGSAGRPKLLVPLRSQAALDALHPAQATIDEACATVGATGIYAFTCQERVIGTMADARHFCTGAGIYEDPVTGVAAVALGWYLWHHGVAPGCCRVKISQGHAMGRPGLILVRQGDDGHLWVHGQAVIGGTVTL